MTVMVSNLSLQERVDSKVLGREMVLLLLPSRINKEVSLYEDCVDVLADMPRKAFV
jgi:hypothetical protein